MRHYLIYSLSFLTVLCLSCNQEKKQTGIVDAIFINGAVITIDPDLPYAEAFAIVNGRFFAVGTNSKIRSLTTSSTKIVDLKGMTITPGFNDSHLHPGAIYDEESPHYTPWLGPEKVKDMDDLIAVLKAKADKTPPGQTVRGARYQDSKLGRHPNRYDLDKASTAHPISITHSSGHVTVVNSYVLKASGINKNTKDPSGGSFDRDPDGTPNGVIRASATRLLRGMNNASQERISFEDEVYGYLKCMQNYSQKGITSIGIAGSSSLQRYMALRNIGSPVRMAFMFSESSFPLVRSIGLQTGFGDNFLRVTAIKVFHGNSLSALTCWLSEPYLNQPEYYGIPPSRSQEDLDKAFQAFHNAGFQIATHSNGDREIDMTLTAIERAQANNPRPDPRHRIEHASVINQSLLERAKNAGVILVFHSYMYEHGDKLESYGEKRLAMMHAYRTAIDMGIHVAGHSDSPVATANPLLCIHDMVNRTGENGVVYGGNQRVTVEEAIKVWTLDGAYTTFEENDKGSITPGKLADFVILRQDPRYVPSGTIKDIIVDATYLGGTKVWQSSM